MPDTARYYLARVHKRGNITTDGVINAIVEPVEVTIGAYLYTFTDISQPADGAYVFAHLAKYVPSGAVEVVEPTAHVAKREDISNLQFARSPFVYIPKHGAVAYQHVWNKLQREQFQAAFARLVEEKHEGFFAECELEPIADLVTFVRRVSELDVVKRLEATVHPPNPLFSPLWRSLRDYMRTRNVSEVHVRETATNNDGLTTNVQRIARRAGVEPPAADTAVAQDAPPLADAAVLMAADGYGKAKVEGVRKGVRSVVSTQESQFSFSVERDPSPSVLYDAAGSVLARIERERGLTHE